MTKRRTDIEVSKLEDDIFRDVVNGASNKELMEKYKLSERSVQLYIARIKERIIAEQADTRREDVLYYKKIAEERFRFGLRIEKEIAEDTKVSPRTRMDAAMRYAEISALDFKLQIETGAWITEYRKLDLPRIVQATELVEEEEPERSSEGDE